LIGATGEHVEDVARQLGDIGTSGSRSSSGRENERYSPRIVSMRLISDDTTASRSCVRSLSGARATS